jgi:hypothetical protein
MTYYSRLEGLDGSPADPPTFRSSELRWKQKAKSRGRSASV